MKRTLLLSILTLTTTFVEASPYGDKLDAIVNGRAMLGRRTGTDTLDLLSMLTGETMSDGPGLKFTKTAPDANDFRSMVRATKAAVMDDLGGNLLLDEYILNSMGKYQASQGENAQAFRGHLGHVYLMARFFQDKAQAQVGDDVIINGIMRDVDEQKIGVTKVRASNFLNHVSAIASKLPGGDLAKIKSGAKTVKIIPPQIPNEHSVPAYIAGYVDKGLLDARYGVLEPQFNGDDQITREESPKDDQGFQRRLYYVKPGNKHETTSLASQRFETSEFLIGQYANQMPYRFLLTDKTGTSHLCGYIDPAFHELQLPATLSAGRILFLSNEKISPNATERAKSYSEHIDASGGVLYPWRDFEDSSFNGYKGIYRGALQDGVTGSDLAANDFRTLMTESHQQGGVARPPLILEGAMPPGYNSQQGISFTKSRGLFKVGDLAGYLEQMDKLYVADQNANMVAAAVKLLAGDDASEVLKKYDDVQALNVFNYWQNLHQNHFENGHPFAQKSKQEIEQYVSSVFAIPYRLYNVDGSFTDNGQTVRVDYVTSLSHLGKHLLQIGATRASVFTVNPPNFIKDDYFMINADLGFFQGASRLYNGLQAQKAFDTLYNSFYTRQALFHLDRKTWKLHKVSDGFVGPDMQLRLNALIAKLNVDYQAQRGNQAITLAKVNAGLTSMQ